MNKIATAIKFRKKTNHWLHFFITMVCALIGFQTTELLPLVLYMFVWCILSASESIANDKVFRDIELALAERGNNNQDLLGSKKF